MSWQDMRYRRLGKTGLLVSTVSLGTWATVGETLDERTSRDILAQAWELGVNLFDTAETYASGATEAALGKALRALAWPRETYAICAKVLYGVHGGRPGSRGLNRKHIVEGCHASLRRLGLDHIDVLLCHRPDSDTPLEETVRAMSDLVTAGKVHYWGTSEWEPEQVDEAIAIAAALGAHPPVTEQLQYNLLRRNRVERDFAPLVTRSGLGITTWSPLAYGLLAGRYDAGVRADQRLGRPGYEWLRAEAFSDGERHTIERARALTAIADEHGTTPAVLAIAWVLHNPAVTTAVCGASKPEHITANVSAVSFPMDNALHDRLSGVFGRLETKEST